MIKVNILSPGRFHVLDLARELDKNGLDVKFYSFVPTRRAEKFGLSKNCSISLFRILLPFIVLERKFFPKRKWPRRLRVFFQDRLTAAVMRKADVTIAMSGLFCYSIDKAKSRGDIIIVERGSKHILEQKRILEAIPANVGKVVIGEEIVKRELHDYKTADYIAIATEHVRRSFMLHHYPIGKLFVNPYGVDISSFYPTTNKEKQYDVLMVGGWGYQKGCDLIIGAIKALNVRFLHVGGIVDLDFPKDNNFTHIDSVDETQLVNYYHQSKVFLLPSRQEGLAMVQIQAIACNLPLIGSPDSGAEDLRKLVANPDYVVIIKDYSVDSVVDALKRALALYERLGCEKYTGDSLCNLTWEAYGKRYADFLFGLNGRK